MCALRERRRISLHDGAKQIRVLTVTESRGRLDHMIDAVNEITNGKGSNFFMLAEASRFRECSPIDVPWTTGKGELVRLTA